MNRYCKLRMPRNPRPLYMRLHSQVHATRRTTQAGPGGLCQLLDQLLLGWASVPPLVHMHQHFAPVLSSPGYACIACTTYTLATLMIRYNGPVPSSPTILPSNPNESQLFQYLELLTYLRNTFLEQPEFKAVTVDLNSKLQQMQLFK